MTTSDKIKFYLLNTPYAKFIRNVEGYLIHLKMRFKKSPSVSPDTVLCISPYKTGTTFLSSSFSPEVSQHEPIHHISYKLLDKDFDKYFKQRFDYLNLKLECSGSWSAYIDELANNEIAKNLQYLCVLRSPSSWITSVINYWNKTNMLKFYYDIPLEHFWQEKVGVNLRDFDFESDSKTNQDIIDKLISYYFEFTEKTSKLKNITYIPLKEISDSIPMVESLIDEKANLKDSWKRENNRKRFIYKNDELDKRYKRLTRKLMKRRQAAPRLAS